MRDLSPRPRRALLAVAAFFILLTLSACSGNDTDTAADVVEIMSPTSTALPLPTPVATAQPTPTPIPTIAPATPTPVLEPTSEPTAVPVEPAASTTGETSTAADSADSSTTESAVAAEDSTAAAVEPAASAGRCILGGVELPVPAGWSQSGCQSFAAVPDFADAGDCPCQYPIDAVIAPTETFAAATQRIETGADYAITGSADRIIAGRTARVYDAEVIISGSRTGQSIAVVELTGGVLFVAATRDATTAPADLGWDATLSAFNSVIDGMVIDGVRTESVADSAEVIDSAADAQADETTADGSTDAETPQADPLPTATAANATECPQLPTMSSTGSASIIDLNNDGRAEAIVPNQLTGDGFKYEVYSHNGDCSWVSHLQLIHRTSTTPKLTFLCRPEPDGTGWQIIEQSRGPNPNGVDSSVDQPYRFNGSGVEQLEPFSYQLDDTTLVFGPTQRQSPILDGDRDLCR